MIKYTHQFISRTLIFILCWLTSITIRAQQSDSLLQKPTLENVIEYAMKHQPLIQQSEIDQETTNTAIKSKLADWYPQINFNYSFLHNFILQASKVPTALTPDGSGIARFGAASSSTMQFAATQNIFNRDVMLASRTATQVRIQSQQNTSANKINLVVSVTKAFYDMLATIQQVKVGQGDVIRLKQSMKTAYDQYVGGVVDKTDYKRASITLSNTQATLKTNKELLKYKTEYLKQLMGYPIKAPLEIVYDTLQMETEIQLDTLQTVDYKERVEYKLLSTQRNLQEANVKYNQWAYLPTASLSGSYSFYYLSNSNSLGDIYRTNTPYSSAILNIGIPLFQGGKRSANIKQQKWMLKRLDWDITNLKSTVNSQYAQALAAYKANLATYLALKQNVELAKEVYDIIQLQYKNGVKTYLEVITGETDYRTARINYFNALYAVLSSKIDVQKALGQINY
ncbi:MAG TPA: TolC family protein [Cyclobacteriaceae bacterium]|jgi:outer membrane protein TolC|nr:TolC family protein [Cyclobacteriaceae bacterium]